MLATLKIRTKLSLGFGSLFLLVAVLVAVTLNAMSQVAAGAARATPRSVQAVFHETHGGAQ